MIGLFLLQFGTVVEVEGTVNHRTPGMKLWESLKVNTEFPLRSEVATGAKSSVTIRTPGGALLKLAPVTYAVLIDAIQEEQRRRIRLDLKFGFASLRLPDADVTWMTIDPDWDHRDPSRSALVTFKNPSLPPARPAEVYSEIVIRDETVEIRRVEVYQKPEARSQKP